MDRPKNREITEEEPSFPFVEVSDLFKDGDWINLHIDVGDATICLAFQEEGFKKFREAINKPPHDVNAPRALAQGSSK